MVESMFGRSLNRSFHPDEVVAIGASVQASILGGSTKAVTLLDVTNFSLGIEVEGQRMAALIPKNTTIPTEATRLVSTVQQDQATVTIHILQGEDEFAKGNTSLGKFELHNIQPGARGEPRIQVHFGIDSSGIVRVSAEDLRSGVSDTVEISSPIGMSQSEITELKESLDSTSTNADIDALRDDINIHVSSLEAKLITKGDDIDPAVVESIKNSIAKARATLSTSDAPSLEAVVRTLEDHAALFNG